MSSRATAGDVRAAVDAVLTEVGWQWDDVDVVATRAWLAADDRLAALGKDVTGFDDDALAAVDIRAAALAPAADAPAAAATTAALRRSVAEPAALLAAGAGSRLVVPKRISSFVTVAAAVGST